MIVVRIRANNMVAEEALRDIKSLGGVKGAKVSEEMTDEGYILVMKVKYVRVPKSMFEMLIPSYERMVHEHLEPKGLTKDDYEVLVSDR